MGAHMGAHGCQRVGAVGVWMGVGAVTRWWDEAAGGVHKTHAYGPGFK
ncbi:hypothetical protein [Hydrogenophaga atypica]|uniref:Uncharacterized protein n=1 Tax=Hydrogenophaga atypica TaxID=249409 RepID=A0ABW2QNF1_9BURK